MRKKIILDTDIGSDIDDSVCLAYLLANPNCDLLGITTVTGEGEKRAQMASALCKLAGKDVPIHVGAEMPLLVVQRQPTAPQAEALSRWSHQVDFPKGEAIEFMRSTIREHPNEITLLTIGPLTNIALLFKADPEIPALLKSMVMMCGAFENDRMEWNAILDPHATSIIYRTATSIHRSVGTDVTLQVVLTREKVRKKFKSTLFAPILDFAEIWFKQNKELIFHDPLAAASIFDDEICDFARGNVAVELTNWPQLGRTHWKRNATGLHETSLAVNPGRFFEHFFSYFAD